MVADPGLPPVLPAAELAPEVMDQLALVLGAAGAGGLSGVSSEQALRVVEAVEAVKSWADSVSVDATAAMVAEFETEHVDLAPDDPSPRQWRRFVRSCRSAAAREIQVATGLPITACQRRVWLAACEPERVGPVREAMRLGRVELRAGGDADRKDRASGRVHRGGDRHPGAAPADRPRRHPPAGGGAAVPGHVQRPPAPQLVLHHGLVGEAERTYQEALKGRCVRSEANPDGSGSLLVTGDGPRIDAAQGRVDQIARRLRKSGDARTLAQLRADVATDLLLRGWIPTDPTFAALGRPPAAQVQLIVSLPTILGLDQGAGQIPGWGAISAQQAQRPRPDDRLDLEAARQRPADRAGHRGLRRDLPGARGHGRAGQGKGRHLPGPGLSDPRRATPTWTTATSGNPTAPAGPPPRPTWPPCTAATTTSRPPASGTATSHRTGH